MHESVAVGLLTAVSTVTAVALTALGSGWVARGQRRHQSRLAERERGEQRALRCLEVRREAYLHFLGRIDEAYRQLDERWTAPPGPWADTGRRDPVYRALRALDEANNRIMLEGPDEVCEQADLTIASISAEDRQQRRLLTDHAEPGPAATGPAATGLAATDEAADDDPGTGVDLAGLEPRRHAAAIAIRVERRSALIQAARRALEPPPPGGD